MARKVRIEFEGATYHVMCRGNHQEAVFRDDRDCEAFLDTLEEVAERNGWRVHAYVLMGNHYHLLLETPEANLVDGMRWLQSTYTQRFNSRHKVWGHLFQGRYKASLVDGGREYFQTVASYIHLNPARAKCFDLENGNLTDYKWSSYPGYLRPGKRAGFLRVERVLGNWGYVDDASGRVAYRERMKKRVLEVASSDCPWEADERWRKIRRGWAYGSDLFIDEMKQRIKDRVSGKRRDSYFGDEIKCHDEKEAERLIGLGLCVCGLTGEELTELKKGDARKKAIAWLVRKRTSVKVEWITSRLEMGTISNFSRHVREVETAGNGLLWELKTKMTKKAD